MAKPEIDQEKLRVFLRSLDNDDLLELLDRAIDLLPRARIDRRGPYLSLRDMRYEARPSACRTSAWRSRASG